MTWRRLAVLMALIVMVLAACNAGSGSTTTPSNHSPGTSDASLWLPCRSVTNIGYAYATQVGPVMLGPTARYATTASRVLAENLFVAACRTVALNMNLPSGPIVCPEDTGSRVLVAFSSHAGSPPKMRMTLFDSGCESISMTAPNGETQASAIFKTPAVTDASHVDSYLVTILRG
jgi:hypothetical protein